MHFPVSCFPTFCFTFLQKHKSTPTAVDPFYELLVRDYSTVAQCRMAHKCKCIRTPQTHLKYLSTTVIGGINSLWHGQQGQFKLLKLPDKTRFVVRELEIAQRKRWIALFCQY